MNRFAKILLLGAAMIAGPAVAGERDTPEAKLEKMLAGRVAGAPVSCINLSRVWSSQVVDGTAIVYRLGNRLYVNQPRSGASSLNDDDVMVTKTFGSQLCRTDTVNLIDRGSRFPRGFVLLGDFVPYTKPEAD